MLFTSWAFLIFLVVVLIGYFILRNRWRWQNILLLVASYVSYAYWDWRFLGLLIGLTAANYGAGWAIDNQPKCQKSDGQKRLWLGLIIGFDLIILGTFKYFNFFDQSIVRIFSILGLHIDTISLKLILPLGISFFIFMAITYPFDIYRGKLHHTRNIFDYALFVSFFPTLVSGPVERAVHMLPQLQSPRRVTSDKINEGLWLMAWGFFQKMVIADNVGLIVNRVFDNYTAYHGMDIIIAIMAYTIQILADFSGYTDIARGVARLLGFEIFLNFNVPYIALNPSDFWSRWHISLSQWFRDYLYIPLGGNKKGKFRTALNLFITMVLVGLWHGAAWTFILWGAWHGLLQVIYRLFGEKARSTDRTIRSWMSVVSLVLRTGLMLILVMVGWAVFRSTSFAQLSYIFSHLGFSISPTTLNSIWTLFYFSFSLIIVQIFQIKTFSPVYIARLNPWLRGLVYGIVIVGILIFSQREIIRFIYQGF
jgi:alginate O-acetyltransferase complex protein AlgI